MIGSIPSLWHFQHNYGYHMHPTWYHMHTMWVSHAHHVSVTCHKGIRSTPNVISWLTLFRPCDISNIIMGITCTPHGYHMHTMWVSHAHHVSVTCHKGITSTPNVISWLTLFRPCDISNIIMGITCSAVVDATFVDIYVDTKNIPTCRYNIQHIDKRTMEK